MALSIRDPKTEDAVRRLAALKGIGLTEAIREAVEKELAIVPSKHSLIAEVEAVVAAFNQKHPPKGPAADKAYFDWIAGEED